MLQRMVFMYSVHTSGRPLLIRVVIRYGFRDTKYFLAWGILSIRGICRKSCLEAKFPCQFRVFGGIPGTRCAEDYISPASGKLSPCRSLINIICIFSAYVKNCSQKSLGLKTSTSSYFPRSVRSLSPLMMTFTSAANAA